MPNATSRTRLLLVSPLPPPPGGIATWTRQVLESPLAERFEVHVLDTSPREAAAVHGPVRFSVRRALDALLLLARLVRVLRRLRPRLVHVNSSYYWAFVRDGLCLWIARGFGARTLLHLHGGDFPDFHAGCPAPLRALVDATLRRADRVVAITRDTEAFLAERIGARAACYLPNFVRASEFARPRARRAAEPVEVLFAGWIIETKGVRELLAAARELPRARFTLVGPSDPAFVASIRDALAALCDRVRILPPQPREEMGALYARADLLVLPTYREGFPNVVLEAMAAGLPVVASRVGAIPEAVQDGEHGALVPPRDPAALAAALRRLIDDPAHRADCGRRARARAEDVFDVARVLARLEDVYRALCGSGASSGAVSTSR